MSDIDLVHCLLDLHPLAGFSCKSCLGGIHKLCNGTPCQCGCPGWLRNLPTETEAS